MKTLSRITPTPSTVSFTSEEQRELTRRLQGPQRHRLLQGYPMRRLMDPVRDASSPEEWPVASNRGLIVGVLPHAFCNPKVRGCGFCTFPQEPYRSSEARETVDRVVREIRRRTGRLGLHGRRADSLYFGGATANLTSPDRFEALCTALLESFDLQEAEVTLEGVPAYFLSAQQALLDLLCQMPVRQRRISMGVQTFDPGQIKEMGRTAFGSPRQIASVVARAREQGMTTSGDFLINLPGQTREEIEKDMAQAVNLGFDQVCVYHLVLFPGLGTPWSRDPEKMSQLPDKERAYAGWQAAREALLERGYVQTTLTNFERAEIHASERRFRYEECSFQASRYDGIGFGPSAISCFANDQNRRALKLINTASASEYVTRMDESDRAYGLQFEYQPEDTQLLHLTRGLSALKIDRLDYREFFGSDPVEDFSGEFGALQGANLVEIDSEAVRLTRRGMFSADSVAGLLAWRRSQRLRLEALPQDLAFSESGPEFMG